MPPLSLHPRLGAALRGARADLSGPTATLAGTTVRADDESALRHRMANTLYEVLHAGLAPDSGPRPRTLRDEAYERLLADAVPHRETALRIPAAHVAPAAGPELRTVLVEGVRTLVPATAVRDAGDGTAVLDYPCARPALSAGFFLVDGSAGSVPDGAVARYYFHLEDADAAPEAWGLLLRALERRAPRYRAKVGSSRLLYPRRDAMVVYLDPRDADAADLPEVASRLPGLGRSTSVFGQELAPGLATAREPSDSRPGMRRMSFGQHRAYAVADGLLEHARDGGSGAVDQTVARALMRAQADPRAPWRNLPEGHRPGAEN